MKIKNKHKGDVFENYCYKVIARLIESGDLALIKSRTVINKKHKIESKFKNSSKIEFDLVIDAYNNDKLLNKIFQICIECKDWNKKIPKKELANFINNLDQVSAHKGIFISSNGFQKGAYELAEQKNIMLIKTNLVDNGEYAVLLHNEERTNANAITNKICSAIKNAFIDYNKLNLKKLRKKDIEQIAYESYLSTRYKDPKINNFDRTYVSYIMSIFEEKYKIKFITNKSISKKGLGKVYGLTNFKKNEIHIDKSIVNTNKFSFVLGHEIGHFILHKDLYAYKTIFYDLEDSIYNCLTNKHEFKNAKNWIEWQANRFAVELFLPKDELIYEFRKYRTENFGKRFAEYIYLDSQSCNIKDYHNTLIHLSNHFCISKTVIRYRLKEFDLLKEGRSSYYRSQNRMSNLIQSFHSNMK